MENSFLMERVNKCRQQVEDLNEQIAAVQKQHALLVLAKDRLLFGSSSNGFPLRVARVKDFSWPHFRRQERLEDDLEREGSTSLRLEKAILKLRTSNEHTQYRLSADQCE